MSLIVLRTNHDPRGILIETMHDARPDDAVDARKVVTVMQQRIDQRAMIHPRRRMHDHAARLVHDDDVGILVENVQRDVLWLHGECLRLGQGIGDFLARRELPSALPYFSVHRDLTGRAELLHMGAGEILLLRRHEDIQSLARPVHRADCAPFCCHFVSSASFMRNMMA